MKVNEPAADGLFHLVLDVSGTPLPRQHTTPGQHVKLSLAGRGEGYFAIASAPGSGEAFEFLIKAGTPLADALKAQRPGGLVLISAVGGQGFPLRQARGKNLLLFATGSGISAIRSVIEAIRQERSAFGQVTLFFGVRTPAAFAYDREIASWEQAGIRVLRTVSRPGTSGWQGLTGYVQAHLGEVPVAASVAFLVGQEEMVREVTKALVRRGLAKEDVHLNF